MKTQKQSNESRRGSAILTVLVVSFVMTLVLGTMVTASLHRVFTARKLADRVRAKAIAEAGVNHAYSMLVTNFALREDANAFPPTAYGDGVYDVTVKCLGNNVAILCSTGNCGMAAVSVIADVVNYGVPYSDVVPPSPAFDYAMICGGEFSFRGCGYIDGTNGTAKIHSNGAMSLAGNAHADVALSSSTSFELKSPRTIDGDVTAPSVDLHGGATVTGTTSEEPVEPVEIPDIDLTPYYNWALEHGEVRDGFTCAGGTYTPNGGILWVNGDVHLSAHYDFHGSIIATGAINMSGQGDVTATTCAFSLVSRDGPLIHNTSGGKITGIIYARMGDYKQTANGVVEGQIIVKGDIDKAGCSDVDLWSKKMPEYPGEEDGEDSDLVAFRAWQK